VTDPMETIARDMRALPEATRKVVRPALREAGNLVARDARQRASWSSRIPATVRVEGTFRADREGVVIRAGGGNAPHARPYEGLTSGGTTFRHPVFGNDWWVSQAARPFLMPAAEAQSGAATEAMTNALNVAAASLGFG